jgi:hypothetical protein
MFDISSSLTKHTVPHRGFAGARAAEHGEACKIRTVLVKHYSSALLPAQQRLICTGMHNTYVTY